MQTADYTDFLSISRVIYNNLWPKWLFPVGSVVEWSACRTCNPAVPGSSPALATT